MLASTLVFQNLLRNGAIEPISSQSEKEHEIGKRDDYFKNDDANQVVAAFGVLNVLTYTWYYFPLEFDTTVSA